MGSSSSRSTVNIENDTLIVNKSDISIETQNLNNLTSNSIMESTKGCSAGVEQSQVVSFAGAQVAGDFNIGEIDQSQTATVNFSCSQGSEIANTVGNQAVSDMMSKLENSSSADVMAKLAAATDSQQQSGAGSGLLSAGSDSSSDSNTNISNKLTNITDTKKNLKNIISNNVTNNFKASNIDNCIATVKNSQKVDNSGIKVSGSVNIGKITQSQAAKLVSDCVQKANMSGKAIQETLAALKITVKEESETTAKADITGEAKSTQKSTGPIEEIGTAVSGIIGSVGGLMTGMMAPLIILAVVAVIGGLIFYFITKDSGVIDSMSQQQQQDATNEQNGEESGLGGGALYGGYIFNVNTESTIYFVMFLLLLTILFN